MKKEPRECEITVRLKATLKTKAMNNDEAVGFARAFFMLQQPNMAFESAWVKWNAESNLPGKPLKQNRVKPSV